MPLNNRSGLLLTEVSIVDRLPAGMTYIEGSALLDGVPTEPTLVDRVLSWNGVTMAGTQVHTVKLLLAVGAGVTEGEYVNRAQAVNLFLGAALSTEATATVRVVPDPTFDCTDVIGKVFNDVNRTVKTAWPACVCCQRGVCRPPPTNTGGTTSPARSCRTRAVAAISC